MIMNPIMYRIFVQGGYNQLLRVNNQQRLDYSGQNNGDLGLLKVPVCDYLLTRSAI